MRLANGAVECTHGPDPAPEGVDVREDAPVPSVSAEAATAAALACQGDGVSGARVQLVYARASGVPDRYASTLPSFRQWAAQIDDVFNLSASETGGSRHVRYVHDAACQPTVLNVVLSASGDDNLTNTINELRAKGHNRSDRKYLVWMDANVYCGIAQVYYDDRPGQDNPNNGRSDVPGMVARVDSGCWGRTGGLVEVHELAHTLGSVQPTAPNATENGHCTDEYDRMCYPDAAGVTMRTVCASTGNDNRLDCNHDDYFSTAPLAGSWLATHWNTASSAFLTAGGGTPPASTTTTTTTVAPTTTTTRPPPTTTTTTVPPPPPGPSQAVRFVDRAYRDLMGRPPTASESSFWDGLLATGLPRENMGGALVTSTEFRQKTITGYYRTFLNRAPAPAEMDILMKVIADGWLLEWVQTVIVGGDEFFAHRGNSAASYVDWLYSTILKVPAAPADRTFWINAITNGTYDRYTVALAFLTSHLAHRVVVDWATTYFLDRPVDDATMNFWTYHLDSGLRQEYMYAFFVGSAEYWSKS